MTLQTPESGADIGLTPTFIQTLENLSNDAQTLSYLVHLVREIHDNRELRTMIELCANLAGSLSVNANEVVNRAMQADNLQTGAM